MMKEVIEVLALNGSGKTKKEAMNNALVTVQEKVMKRYPEFLILKIEPEKIDVTEIVQHFNLEKFLFLKRKKEIYRCAINLTVKIRLVHIA